MRKIIIQARNGSSRLPKKMVSDIDGTGKKFLSFFLERLLQVFNRDEIVLATSDKPQDDELVEIAKKHSINYFQGDEDNVLKRFIDCAKKFNIDEIIRVCADNPFIYLNDLKKLQNIDFQNFDYISFDINGSPSIKTHYGFWAELVKLSVLEKVASITDEKLFVEHVTNYIYTHRDIFNVKFIETQISKDVLNSNIRLTLDTADDFKNVKKVIRELNAQNLEISVENILKILNENPYLYDKMKEEITKNSK
ncbi:cytidylyltransferase domain-containing protein [Ornithobacterium rhinotracheale]|uniref:cytidylyltransferase domain-containing protein n=1 Tax=Ornithobacterium rhinotracheale TaxID=28251 RepID=UPI0040354E17